MSKQTVRLDPGLHIETTGGHKHIVVDQPAIDAALAAERRATVERIRAEVKALDYRMIEWYHPLPRGGYSLHQVVTWSDVFAILDAEAER